MFYSLFYLLWNYYRKQRKYFSISLTFSSLYKLSSLFPFLSLGPSFSKVIQWYFGSRIGSILGNGFSKQKRDSKLKSDHVIRFYIWSDQTCPLSFSKLWTRLGFDQKNHRIILIPLEGCIQLENLADGSQWSNRMFPYKVFGSVGPVFSF